MRFEVELPHLLRALTLVTQRGERVEHDGLVFAAIREEEARVLCHRPIGDPGPHLRHQLQLVLRLVQPHLDLAVALGKFCPRSVNPPKERNRLAAAVGQKAS